MISEEAEEIEFSLMPTWETSESDIKEALKKRRAYVMRLMRSLTLPLHWT